jgi:hypothetical protein
MNFSHRWSEVLLSRAYRVTAPDRTNGEQAAWNPRPPNDRVSVVAHHAPDCPTHKLLGRIKRPPIGEPERLKLGSEEREQCRDGREPFS